MLAIAPQMRYNIFVSRRHDGMADVTDSKSVDGDIVWVRVPPPAPTKRESHQRFLFVYSERMSGTRRTSGTEQQSGGLLRPRATKRPQARESSPVWGTKGKHSPLRVLSFCFSIALQLVSLCFGRGVAAVNWLTDLRSRCEMKQVR